MVKPATPLRIVFFGTPAFAVPTLDALLLSRHVVVGVVTQPDRPRGRGQKLSDAPVKARAVDAGLPVLQPERMKDPAFLDALAAWGADLGVVAAYGRILTEAILGVPRLGMINVHASLLPRWRGAAPIQRAILAGDAETGVTIMQMEAGLDTGPMLLKRTIPIGPDDSGGPLHDRLADLGANVLVEALAGLVDGLGDDDLEDEEEVPFGLAARGGHSLPSKAELLAAGSPRGDGQ